MKKIFLLLVGLLFAAQLAAQNYTEVVYLKNGSVIRGIITEQIPSEQLTIATRDGNIFFFRMDEVARIVKESPNVQQKPKGKRILSRGYRGFVSLGYTLDPEDYYSTFALDFTTTHGYQCSPYIFVGAGIGVSRIHYAWEFFGMDSDWLEEEEEDVTFVPVYFDLRTTFLRNWVSPYVDIKAGYAFGDTNYSYYNPTAGVHFGFRKGLGLNIGLGYVAYGDAFDGLNFHVSLEF